jgi:hypothetical protein
MGSGTRWLDRLEKAWQALEDSYAGLTEAAMLERGVCGAWSVKDILAHVGSWEQEALKHLPVIAAGGQPGRYADAYGGIDAFNAQVMAQKGKLTLEVVLQEREATHRRLLEYLHSVPEEVRGERRFRKRLRLDTTHHYDEHAGMIRAWREAKGKESRKEEK